MSNPGFIKNYTAAGDIAAKRIAALAAGGNVSQASSGTANLIGAVELACESGSRVDVVLTGIAEVEAGENLNCGDYITSDANGKAVAAGAADTVIGKAADDAAAGEYVSVFLKDTGRGVDIPDSQDGGFTAGAAVAANRIVKFNTGKVVQASAGTDVLLGVSQSAAASADDTCKVALTGVVYVAAGASVNAGAYVTADSNGKAVAATSGKNYIGMALEAAAAADDLIAVSIRPGTVAGA